MEKEKVQADIIGNGYKKLPGGKPARTDLRKKKLNKIIKKESREY